MIKDRIKICALAIVNIGFGGFNRYTSGVTSGEFSFVGMIYFRRNSKSVKLSLMLLFAGM